MGICLIMWLMKSGYDLMAFYIARICNVMLSTWLHGVVLSLNDVNPVHVRSLP